MVQGGRVGYISSRKLYGETTARSVSDAGDSLCDQGCVCLLFASRLGKLPAKWER